MKGTMPGARRRGRPRTAWIDNIKTWTGLPVENSLRQTVHAYFASVHQAAKLVVALLRVAMVISGLAESNGSLPPGL